MLLIDDNFILENIKEKVIDNYINSNKYSNIRQLVNLLSILKTEKVISKEIDLDMQYIKVNNYIIYYNVIIYKKGYYDVLV